MDSNSMVVMVIQFNMIQVVNLFPLMEDNWIVYLFYLKFEIGLSKFGYSLLIIVYKFIMKIKNYSFLLIIYNIICIQST